MTQSGRAVGPRGYRVSSVIRRSGISCSPKELHEIFELIGCRIRHCPISGPAIAPREREITLFLMACHRGGRAACVRHLEQADEMLAVAIDKRCHRLDPHNVNTATYQGKTLGAEIRDRRRKRELTVEPRLDRM